MDSLNALADTVRAAASDRARFSQLTAQLDLATALMRQRHQERNDLQHKLNVERADVRQLERVSPTRIWAVLRGTVDDQLTREKAEADAAAYAVAAAQSRLDSAEADAERIRVERSALGAVDASYAQALAAYEEGLRAAGDPAVEELSAIVARSGAAAAMRREIVEAATALEVARGALADASASLNSAGGWATYDTFFGGGMMADLMKHDRLRTANDKFRAVNRALERLSTELADIQVPGTAGLELSQTLVVFDVLFDNVFTDWVVRDRIAQARDRVGALRTRLDDVAKHLKYLAAETTEQIDELARRREELLTARR